MQLDDRRLRTLATVLGAISLGIGGSLAVAPRLSARLFGLPIGDDPAAPVMFRAAGARDVIINVGLISAARHGGKYAPWVLARTLTDAADVGAALLAIGAGGRRPGLVRLAGVAFLHTLSDALLWQAARRSGSGT